VLDRKKTLRKLLSDLLNDQENEQCEYEYFGSQAKKRSISGIILLF